MLVIAKFHFFIFLFACFIYFMRSRKPRAKPVKRILISKTIIPLDYTGNDHQEWKHQITLERMILSIKNESNPSLDNELEEALRSQNILKLINK